MLEAALVNHCSPTLAGIKTGNLFSFRSEGDDYTYTRELSLGGMMDGYLYETDAEDAGEFRYFLLMPDTPESTYHIEFRYGSDIDALSRYNEGAYAYWLAAGILADYDEQMVEDVIGLFVSENLAETGEDAEPMTE